MSCQGCCIQDEREHPGRKKLGLQTDSRLYCSLRDIAGKIRCKVAKAIRISYCAGARVPTEHVGSSWQVSNLRLIVVGKTLNLVGETKTCMYSCDKERVNKKARFVL